MGLKHYELKQRPEEPLVRIKGLNASLYFKISQPPGLMGLSMPITNPDNLMMSWLSVSVTERRDGPFTNHFLERLEETEPRQKLTPCWGGRQGSEAALWRTCPTVPQSVRISCLCLPTPLQLLFTQAGLSGGHFSLPHVLPSLPFPSKASLHQMPLGPNPEAVAWHMHFSFVSNSGSGLHDFLRGVETSVAGPPQGTGNAKTVTGRCIWGNHVCMKGMKNWVLPGRVSMCLPVCLCGVKQMTQGLSQGEDMIECDTSSIIIQAQDLFVWGEYSCSANKVGTQRPWMIQSLSGKVPTSILNMRRIVRNDDLLGPPRKIFLRSP